MFGVGFTELIVLGIIVSVLIGPEQIPTIVKALSKLMREISKAKNDLDQSIDGDEHLRTLRNSVRNAKNTVDSKIYSVKSHIDSHLEKMVKEESKPAAVAVAVAKPVENETDVEPKQS